MTDRDGQAGPPRHRAPENGHPRPTPDAADPRSPTTADDDVETIVNPNRRPRLASETTNASAPSGALTPPTGISLETLQPDRRFSLGTLVGRYVILGVVGSGGMGIVYVAHDPDLDRRVALKVLRPELDTFDDLGISLMDEAKAMARLSDPNVCTVYEIGTFFDHVFIAMEYIHGQTLKSWLLQEDRSWREILDVMVEAGRGLQAAHDSGIIHRDFKPDNLMIDDHGRVRVMDFGVAGQVKQTRALRDVRPAPPVAQEDMSEELTSVVGTIGYIAPEQFRGHRADQRSDQFSFCVTFYSALFRKKPYPGRTLDDYQDAFEPGASPIPPTDSRVPRWLRQIILRGLSPDPNARYRSMSDLVEDLIQVPKRRRRLALAAAATVLFAVLALTIFGLYRQKNAASQLCTGSADRMQNVWNEERRGALEQAFLATKTTHASDQWQRVAQAVDGYSERWVSAHRAACEATRVHGEQSDEMLDRRMLCFNRRLGEIDALYQLFAKADPQIVRRAVDVALSLGDLDRCDARAELLTTITEPEDPKVLKQIGALRERLDQVKVRLSAGKFADALPEAENLVKEADAIGYSRTRAEALLLVGVLRSRLAELDLGTDALMDAALAAKESRDTMLEAEAFVELTRYVGFEAGRVEQGRMWARFANAILSTVDKAPRLRVRLARHHAITMYRAGDHEACWDLTLQSVEIGEKELGPEDPDVIRTLLGHGICGLPLGHWQTSMPLMKNAIESSRRVLGAEHPWVADGLNNMGNSYATLGKLAEARAYYREALELWESSLGKQHPNVAVGLSNVGQIALLEEDYSQAIKLFQRALSIEENHLGENNPKSAITLSNLGRAHFGQGQEDKARKVLERALRIFGKAENASVAQTQFSLAQVLDITGDGRRARELARKARRTFKGLGNQYDAEVEDIEEFLAGD